MESVKVSVHSVESPMYLNPLSGPIDSVNLNTMRDAGEHQDGICSHEFSVYNQKHWNEMVDKPLDSSEEPDKPVIETDSSTVNQTVNRQTELVKTGILNKPSIHTGYISSDEDNHAYEQAVDYLENWAYQKNFMWKRYMKTHTQQYFPLWFNDESTKNRLNKEIDDVQQKQQDRSQLLDWMESSDDDPDHYGLIPNDWNIPASLRFKINQLHEIDTLNE